MLLCVLDHPTQYDPPLWRACTRIGGMSPKVWYMDPDPPADPEIQREVHWSSTDNGYDHSHVSLSRLPAALLEIRPRPAAILVPGWKRPATLCVLPIAKALGIPIILATDKTLNEPSPAGVSGSAYTLLHASKAKLFDGFLTTGLLGTQYLASIGCSHTRIATGLYPIDVDHWRKRRSALVDLAAKLRALAAPDAFVFVAVCKLSEREHPTLLLDALAEIRVKHQNAFLIQVGDGPLRGSFEERVRTLNLQQAVHLAGYVDYDSLAGYYGAADVFVHVPSREPWGISVLEAMACGLPVIASTTVGAAADLVVHGRTGALTYPSDKSSLVHAMSLALGRAKPERWGKRALARAHNFDVDRVAQSLSAFVQRLKADPSPGPSVTSALRAELRNEFGRWPR